MFLHHLIYNFFIAFGVIVGASLFAGIGALINNHPPLKTMLDVASSLKIWAVAVALGGTFSSFQIIEKGLLKGELKAVIKQISYIVVALIGAHIGYRFIQLIQNCGRIWMQ
ncbi:YtrH family sporulation protein [Clostridiaceae bacterium 35-E11]